ncbi:hypothetical protein RGQ29_031647 [Quercus rubra]|uniref:Uncharacterized protein n=1 Tax=Quercus rubra TaxID=3512 RepID=A0AAN7IIV9_QUERU|nr:hypothetical protein RGQ29_031647 [Quercus rubra]KAK4573783.1 hypothetical protein RGQ29_031647 [Quercus rubra]KAK4573784.1 hypothetical protein RGQ29_031647 [Quercus rubra]
MQNEESVTTELLDQSGKERPYTLRNRGNMCPLCRAPVNDGETFNEGGSGSSWRDNGGGSGPRGPSTPSNKDENNLLSQFLAKPRNLFLLFLLVFVLLFFLFLFLFLCLFVFVFYFKGCRG